MFTQSVDRVENKGTTYNYFPTYAVVSLCFGLRKPPLRAKPKQVRRFVEVLSKHKCILRPRREQSLTSY